MISHMALKQRQNAEEFCSALSEKKTYNVLEDLCAPQKSSEKSFEEIKHLLLEHFKPKNLVIAENYRFYNAKQKEGDSVFNFFVFLKHHLHANLGQFQKEHYGTNLCVG